MFQDLLPPSITVFEADPRTFHDPVAALMDVERSAIGSAVAKRQHEFAVARILVRRALASMGRRASALLNGKDRAPIWPTGVVGSITHTAGYCAVALAEQTAMASLGIDVEEATPLSAAVYPVICSETERAWLSTRSAAERAWLGKLLFSIKESVYKLQYPQTGTFLGFDAVEVVVDVTRGTWHATFRVEAGVRFPIGHVVAGRWAHEDGFVASATSQPCS